jgi:EpsD family peptidyl-prolyl cis-trans isomerase
MKSVLAAILIAAPTAACERAAADRVAEHPVARVNGTAISMREARAGAPGAAQALDKVIERELLVQQALAARLDRDPEVARSIEEARREVLAQAWLERASGAAGGASRDEVRAFYRDNPALFAERRIYRLRELAVSASAEMVEGLRAEVARAHELDEVAAWLRSRGAKPRIDSLTQPAEQLPLAFLPRLARMQAGEIALFSTPHGASVIQLARAEPAPLGEAQAAPLIEQFLAGRRRLEAAATEVKRLREIATIEYLGEFKRGD